jgi:5'-nucleotidase
MAQGGLTSRHKRALVGSLAAVALGTALVAPLATSSGSAGAVTISGAQSLADNVSVQFEKATGRTTAVHLLAFNDLHGNLEAGTLNIYGHFAGGAAYLAKAIKDRQAVYGARQVTLMAGDNIGASPLASGFFHDEPIMIASNLMHVDLGSVGNHEFDEGKEELLRMQNGGCHPKDGCNGPYALANGGTTNIYPGADFRYLAANVVRNDTGETLFPPYEIKTFTGDSGKPFRVGFIGEVLESTPTIVTPTGVAGLTFLDEADSANKAAKQLKDQGVNAIVLVIHQGGFQTPTPTAVNGCAGNLAGSDIASIASRLDKSIGVIVSGHTHAEYRCTITANKVTRLITSASSFGRILTDLKLTVDDNSGKVAAATADNIIVDNALNAPGPGVVRQPDPSKSDSQVAAVVNQYVTASAPLANTIIGKVAADINNTANALGEIPSGDVIADAQLAATRPANLGGAQVAFMNPGGIRGGATSGFLFVPSGQEAPGEVTYGEAFNVQPFGNSLVTKTMTGAQIRSLLEQQFVGCGSQTTQRILQISAGFTYQQKAAGVTCADKIGAISLNGTPLDAAGTYRVTMNNFLATGGDGFTVFNQGTNALGGAQDIDALVAYFGSFLPNAVPNPPVNRITAA